MFISTD
ncbi:hypothetical protein YPPY60_3157, partial [Yersinia pestis PY-60]